MKKYRSTAVYAFLPVFLAGLFVISPYKGYADAVTVTGNTAVSRASQQAVAKPLYYGTWRIAAVLGRQPDCALTDAEVQGSLNTRLYLSRDVFSDNSQVIANPVYENKIISNADFYNETHCQLEYIGVKTNALSQINIFDGVSDGISSEPYASLFLTRDGPVYLKGGVFFRLVEQVS